MSDLTDFLLARFDEDAARDCGLNTWVPTFHRGLAAVEAEPAGPRMIAFEARPRWPHAAGVVRGVHRHIARNDPVRVLAECEAKRQIVIIAERSAELATGAARHQFRRILWFLAQPPADHPDFREEWRP